MRPFEIGVMLPMVQLGPARVTPRWTDIREMALLAETMGFDTLWTPDELPVASRGRGASGYVGRRIHGWRGGSDDFAHQTRLRTPGGPGLRPVGGGTSGHHPPDTQRVCGFRGQFPCRCDLHQLPVGPRPNAIPLIGGNGPKGQRPAVLHADIWSGYAEERAHVDELEPRLATLDAICAELGRDAATICGAAGISVNPLQPSERRASVISGPPEEIAGTLFSFRGAGFIAYSSK